MEGIARKADPSCPFVATCRTRQACVMVVMCTRSVHATAARAVVASATVVSLAVTPAGAAARAQQRVQRAKARLLILDCRDLLRLLASRCASSCLEMEEVVLVAFCR